jgi:hypothetical protein
VTPSGILNVKQESIQWAGSIKMNALIADWEHLPGLNLESSRWPSGDHKLGGTSLRQEENQPLPYLEQGVFRHDKLLVACYPSKLIYHERWPLHLVLWVPQDALNRKGKQGGSGSTQRPLCSRDCHNASKDGAMSGLFQGVQIMEETPIGLHMYHLESSGSFGLGGVGSRGVWSAGTH